MAKAKDKEIDTDLPRNETEVLTLRVTIQISVTKVARDES